MELETPKSRADSGWDVRDCKLIIFFSLDDGAYMHMRKWKKLRARWYLKSIRRTRQANIILYAMSIELIFSDRTFLSAKFPICSAYKIAIETIGRQRTTRIKSVRLELIGDYHVGVNRDSTVTFHLSTNLLSNLQILGIKIPRAICFFGHQNSRSKILSSI